MVDDGYLKVAKELLQKARDKSKLTRFSFYLPHDVVVADKADRTAETRVVDISEHSWADIVTYPKRPHQSFYTVRG